MSRYENFVNALKSLEQQSGNETITLPVAEDEWYTRPKTESYGIVSIDFEADTVNGDSLKMDTVHEGSVDLFSMVRGGEGWIPLIKALLTEYWGPSWSLNSHTYERETGLFHWEWTFEIIEE